MAQLVRLQKILLANSCWPKLLPSFLQNHTVSPNAHAKPHFSDKLDYCLGQLKCIYRSRALIRVTPQHHNTYTPAMAHAWGRSVMIVVCVGY